MSTEVPRNGPPSEDESPLSKLEQDFDAGNYTKSIEDFYVAHDDFFNSVTYTIKTAEIVNREPKSEMNFSLIPIAESFGDVLDQINANEADWDDKSNLMAGFLWSERKRRGTTLNSILKKPIPYDEAGTTELDDEEKCANDAIMVNRFKDLLDNVKNSYLDDELVIQYLKQGYMHEIVNSLTSTFNQYTLENPNQKGAANMSDFAEDFEFTHEKEDSENKHNRIGRVIGKHALDIAKITTAIMLANYLSKKFGSSN